MSVCDVFRAKITEREAVGQQSAVEDIIDNNIGLIHVLVSNLNKLCSTETTDCIESMGQTPVH